MKKFLIVFVLVATGLVANAQFFVGGNIGFSSMSGKSEVTTTFDNKSETVLSYESKISNFEILPVVGYMFSDVIGFGATVGFVREATKVPTDPMKKEYNDVTKTSGFAFAPFFRYIFANFANIQLYADAKLPIVFGSEKRVYEQDDKTTLQDFLGLILDYDKETKLVKLYRKNYFKVDEEIEIFNLGEIIYELGIF